MSKEIEIYNYLFNLNVCKRCCLRYICVRNQEVYDNIDEYLLEKSYLNVEQINATEDICIVCLGLLQDSTLNDVVNKINDSLLVKEYDSNTFSCSVSYPASIQVREHAIRLHLDDKFPDFYTFDIQETMLNKTWKWSIKNKISSALKKKFVASETSNFSINVITNYSLDEEELKVLLKMLPDYFTKRQVQKRKFKGEIFSRKGVTNVLTQIPTGVFKLQGDLPPKKAAEKISCQEVECFHTSIFFAGRYNKYSRKLPQTPWILNGVRMLESSVQEVIFEPFRKILNIPVDGLKFSSSGREDVDVRCLGNGRPFYLEYLNPKKTQISFEEFRQIEEEINNSKDVKVRYMQLVKREELIYVKHGEESKTKEYEATCYITKGIFTDDFIKEFNTKAPFVLQQKTPLRVLHRRALAVRERIIHSANILRVPGYENVVKLRVNTQAGTYVKEFIHGDFGRTIPNLDFFGDKADTIDIIALDVTAVNLDWPSPV